MRKIKTIALSSLYIFLPIALGMLFGLYNQIDIDLDSYITYTLYVLLLTVGISVGLEFKKIFKDGIPSKKVIIFPFIVIVGSLVGCLAAAYLFKMTTINESLAIASGLGYYSLSSIIITKISGEHLGTLALCTNIFREFLTIILAPLLVKFFGKTSVISSAGATSMDTCLPIIVRYSGKNYSILAIFNGVILSILVPILVPLFL